LFSSIAPTRPNYAKTAVYNVALLVKISDRVHDLRLTWTNVSACAASILTCSVYLHSEVLAIRFIFSKPSVLGGPRDTPVNDSDIGWILGVWPGGGWTPGGVSLLAVGVQYL